MNDFLDFNESAHNFPMNIMMGINRFVNDVNCGILTRLSAESEILAMIKNTQDIVAIRLLSCIKAMVETLSLVTQKKEIKEFELCTRYLQPAFQKLFDCDDNELVFKWLNVNCFDDSQQRPDGIIKNDEKAVGYFEVKPIKYAKDHRRINMDF